jgi:hypothetical protein
LNNKGLFILEPPHLLDQAFADLLYMEATSQRSDGSKSILSILRQSLKLGNPDSGWILINFSRPADLSVAKDDEKANYFSYLVACVVLNYDAAQRELEKIISKIVRKDLEYITKIFLKYCELGFSVQAWLQSIQRRCGCKVTTSTNLHLMIDRYLAGDVGTIRS